MSNQTGRRLHDGLPLPRRRLSRRRFLRNSALGAAGLAAGPRLLTPRPARAAELPARVVRTYHDGATTGSDQVNQEAVDQMIHHAIRVLTGHSDIGAAWKSLFPGIDATKKIAIKINLACGDVPTHPEIIHAVIDGLLMMDLDGQQLPEEHITVWDHDTGFFCEQTGYVQNWGGPGVQYVGTDHPQLGFDESYVFPIVNPGGTTYHSPSKIITQHCDYLINAAVMKDHDDWAGVTLTLKNHFGSFSGIYDVATHYQGFDTAIPGLSCILRDGLGDKQKLFLVDATYCLCDGGPGYTPPWHTPPNWTYNSLLMATDMVALDKIGLVKMNQERDDRGLAPITASHVAAAAAEPHKLGTDDLEHIELLEFDLSDPTHAPEPPARLGLALLAPYPNPSRGPATLRFQTRQTREIDLVVTDVTGAVVRRLHRGAFAPGLHRIRWNGRDDRGRPAASGTYFCRLRAGDHQLLRQFVVTR